MKTKNGLRRVLAAMLILSLAAAMVLWCGCDNEEKERKTRTTKSHEKEVSFILDENEDEEFSKEEIREYAFKQIELTGFEEEVSRFDWHMLRGFVCTELKETDFSSIFARRFGVADITHMERSRGYYCECADLEFLMTEVYNLDVDEYHTLIQGIIDRFNTEKREILGEESELPRSSFIYEEEGRYYFPELVLPGPAGIYYNCRACYYDGEYFYFIITEDEVLGADEKIQCTGTYCAKMQYKQTERGMLWSLYSFTDTLPDTSDVDPQLHTFDEVT